MPAPTKNTAFPDSSELLNISLDKFNSPLIQSQFGKYKILAYILLIMKKNTQVKLAWIGLLSAVLVAVVAGTFGYFSAHSQDNVSKNELIAILQSRANDIVTRWKTVGDTYSKKIKQATLWNLISDPSKVALESEFPHAMS